MKKERMRRSVSIPKELDAQISIMSNQYAYTVKNDLYVELLELGILKFREDMSLRNEIINLISRMDKLLEELDHK